MTYENRRVLITGANGFIGRKLMGRLCQLGASVIAPSRQRCDLSNPYDVLDLFKAEQPEIVFHVAGKVAGIEENSTRPIKFLTENLKMGLNVVESAVLFGVERFINLGSACSYPKYAQVPVSEESLHEGYPEETNGAYGIAKRTIVDLCETVRLSKKMDAISVISANCYGPGDKSNHVIPDLVSKFLEAARTEASEVSIWGSGEPTRDFLYVDDLVDGLLCAGAYYTCPGPVNVGSNRETSIKELAGIISRLIGYRGRINFDHSKPDGQPRRLLDIDKAASSWGFSPRISLEDGLEKTIRWKQENRGA
jgi:GDP-L-fucose synthase